MAIEPPARFAVIGAGPIGLEAALYARYLGFEVVIYDQGEICEHVRRWSHVELLTPFKQNSTSLGRQALRAQTDGAIDLPAPDAMMTAQEWMDRYLLPLANTDLLVDSFRLRTSVTDVSRLTYAKTDMDGAELDGEDEERRDEPLRVMSIDADGNESVDYFDAVIDASGVQSTPLGIGPGGAYAIGERGVEGRIGRVLLRDDELAALPRGATALVVGPEFSAARQIAKLAEIAERDPEFRCVWISRRLPQAFRSPDPREPYLVEANAFWKQAILTRANELATSAPWLTFARDVVVEEIRAGEGERLDVRFVGRDGLPEGFEERRSFDRVLAFVGYRPDLSITQECQVDYLLATDSPAPSDAIQPESDLYIVGAKEYGRESGFFLSVGYRQIVEVFKVVNESNSFDLYARAAKDEGPEWSIPSPG